MLVSIIIINYNSFALTSDSIRSVIKQTNDVEYEIILVDNASTECDAEIFLSEFPKLKLIKSETNGGFSYGNNLGIEKARGEYVLLLNSDTIMREDSISKSVKYMEQKQEVAVLGCRMIFPNGDVQYSARRFKSISWELLDIFRFIPLLMSYEKRSKRLLGKYFRHDTDIECDWVSGAFFLIPRKIIDQLQGKKLDERFFMYGEDQLWCEQIKKLGYKILFYSGTTIIHISSGSTDMSKQLALRKIMMKHELEIVRLRKGEGLYYFLFKIIYISKETTRNFIKAIILRFTGKLIRR
jgi:GT2 family glycosyltransferase